MIESWRKQLDGLLHKGAVGDFGGIEFTEIVATPPDRQTLNVITVAVLSEGLPVPAVGHSFLTGRLKVGGFPKWSFGVRQSLLPLTALDATLATFAATGSWRPTGAELGVGDLRPEPALFVPPDGTEIVALNGILKNNFFAGSHVFRLVDLKKAPFGPFFQDRRRLQDLSDQVSKAVPIRLAGLADVLGDIVIQVPVTLLVPRVGAVSANGKLVIDAVWRSGARVRPLTAAVRARSDGLISGAAVATSFVSTAELPVDPHLDPVAAEIWDAEAGRLLAATAPTSTLRTIVINMAIGDPEPRVFDTRAMDGSWKRQRLTVRSNQPMVMGQPDEGARFWSGRRQMLEERQTLDERREFVQYRPKSNVAAARARALDDVRLLIERHGAEGVDLWDPFLSAVDLLDTLFWCGHADAPMRALGSGREPRAGCERNDEGIAESFTERQRATLAQRQGNARRLRLEYRVRRGPEGWGFHDRFLIFPNGEAGPQAWSLGTSVNALGKSHHILQRVGNPALIAGAFQDLWGELSNSRHFVWRSW
jgi:hypothetical protein